MNLHSSRQGVPDARRRMRAACFIDNVLICPDNSPPDMTTIGMNYDVLAGKEDVFLASFRNVLGLLRTLPDHVDSRLYRDTESTNQFLIVSMWKSRTAFTDFIRSQAFKDVTSWGKAEILAGRPTHTVYSND